LRGNLARGGHGVRFPAAGPGDFEARQQFIEIDGHVSSAAFKTEGNLGIAQAWLSGETVGCADPVAKNFFHGLAQIAAHVVQMTRDAGFVLAEQTSNLSKSFFLGVIEAKPLLFLGVEAIERGLQGAGEGCEVAFR